MFNQDELRAISNLLNRVQIQGNEATALAILQQKIAKLIKPEEKKEEKK